jgi:hypothetical protein
MEVQVIFCLHLLSYPTSQMYGNVGQAIISKYSFLADNENGSGYVSFYKFFKVQTS